jgi:hypothetical protein
MQEIEIVEAQKRLDELADAIENGSADGFLLLRDGGLTRVMIVSVQSEAKAVETE